jgi:tubulin polyglutamylase TTLL9
MDYLPPSYVLPSEYPLFVEEYKKYPTDSIWIMKPVSGAQGRGIFLFKKLKDITEWKKTDRNTDTESYVVQVYIHRFKYY